MELTRLRLCHNALSGRDLRRTQTLATKHHGVVQIQQRGVRVEIEFGECERQTAPNEQWRGEALPAKARELLDDARHRAIGEVEAAVEIGVVVAPLALELLRKPQR